MRHATVWPALALALGSLLGSHPAAGQPKQAGPGAGLGVASVPNLRDAGGYKTRDGRLVRTGLLYRSSQPAKVKPADREKLAALGLKTVFDLRTAAERKAAPDELPAGVWEVWLDVLGGSKQDAPARIARLLKTPMEATAELGGGKAEALLAGLYREFVSLPSARKALGRLYRDLTAAENLPAVVHCTSGRDRTGWATAALLTLLGVPDDVVAADFLRSNEHFAAAYRPHVEAFAKAGGDPAVMTAVASVRPEYLAAAFDEVKARSGTIEDYFAKGLDVDAAGQAALRARFLARD